MKGKQNNSEMMQKALFKKQNLGRQNEQNLILVGYNNIINFASIQE